MITHYNFDIAFPTVIENLFNALTWVKYMQFSLDISE